MDRTKRNERSFAVFLIGLLAFSVPILEIFSAKGSLFGVPLLLIYCFAVRPGFPDCLSGGTAGPCAKS